MSDKRRFGKLFIWAAATSCVLAGACTPQQSADSDEQRPITKLSPSMLVDPASLPKIDGGEWTVGKVRSEDQSPRPDKFIPPECAPLVGEVDHTQRASVRFLPGPDSWTRAINLWLYVTPNPPDAKTLLPKCGSVTDSATKDNPNYSPRTFKPVEVAGIPPWAVAADQDGSVYVMGSYRGIFLLADFAPEREDVAVQVFNDQVEKLAAA